MQTPTGSVMMVNDETMTTRSQQSTTVASMSTRALYMQRRSDDEVTKIQKISWWACLLIFLVVISMELCNHETMARPPHQRFYRRAVRLCSRSLSDALYLLCKDRGYNEPFSSSGETEVRHTTGPGLVEECCYNACSIEQMEQYCKPRGKEMADCCKESRKRKGNSRRTRKKPRGCKCNGAVAGKKAPSTDSSRTTTTTSIFISTTPKYQRYILGTTAPEPINGIIFAAPNRYYGLDAYPETYEQHQ